MQVTITVKPQGARATYKLTRTNSCGSFSQDYTFVADGPCLEVEFAATELTVAPNPVVNSFTVSLNNEDENTTIEELSIQDKFGQEVRRMKFGNKKKSQELNIQILPPDIYVVRVFNGEKWLIGKVIKQ